MSYVGFGLQFLWIGCWDYYRPCQFISSSLSLGHPLLIWIILFAFIVSWYNKSSGTFHAGPFIVCCWPLWSHTQTTNFVLLCYADRGPKFIQLRCWRCLALSDWWICWVSEREWHYPEWSVQWLQSKTMMHSLNCCKRTWSVVSCDMSCAILWLNSSLSLGGF